MQIVNLFYELAREHKRVNGFAYGRDAGKGAGNDAYPLTWVNDPITGTSLTPGVLQYTVNVDILGLPVDDTEIQAVQDAAFMVGLSYAEKVLQSSKTPGAFKIDRFTFISLRNYYDDNAAGWRFTYTITQANPINRCNTDFDPTKQFPTVEALPSFETDAPEGCAVFSDKGGLPNFKLD